MKRIVSAAVTVVLSVAVLSPAALAGPETGPKVALHLTTPPAKAATICTSSSPNVLDGGIPCTNYNTHGDIRGANQLIYLVIAQADTSVFVPGIAGINLGIEYNGTGGVGVDVQGNWTLCADSEFPSDTPPWPQNGAGNVITWEPSLNCQKTVLGADGIHAVAGAFTVYVYSNDIFRVTPNRTQLTPDVLAVADCSAAQTEIDTTGVAQGAGPIGWVGFGNCLGCNPCVSTNCTADQVNYLCRGVPVEPLTWGKIKTLYR